MALFVLAKEPLTGKMFSRILFRYLPSSLTKGLFFDEGNTWVRISVPNPFFFFHFCLKQMGFLFLWK